MKGQLDRTKVVLRHLPPSISESALMEHVDSRFAGRYNWVSFHPGKSSQKHQNYSRAYIDLNRSDDVIEFAEYFGGHVFVNEKGSQFKTIVEYAPSQRVPKQWSKKDGREGTISKDPEYLEFLEILAKPVENLPSAELQLERKEAERAGASKDALIVTPLMDYIRQKRAAKSASRRSSSNGRLGRRVSGTSAGSPSSSAIRRGSEKRRTSTAMYIQKDSAKAASVDTDGSGFANAGKKKVLLLKGKERELPLNQRHEAGGRIIRSILLNKDGRRTQSSSMVHSERPIQISNQVKDKRPPRPPSVQSFHKDTNGVLEDRVAENDVNVIHLERLEKRTRGKDRPDRGVWARPRRLDSSDASNESLSSLSSQPTQVMDGAEGNNAETKSNISGRGGDTRSGGSFRGSFYSVDNGSYRHGSRRTYNIKDANSSPFTEVKHLRRGVSSGLGAQEKQVWVQKSSSGS